MSMRDLDQLARELMSDDSLPADLKALALRGTMAVKAVLDEFAVEAEPVIATPDPGAANEP
jgi:hypothetical protein